MTDIQAVKDIQVVSATPDFLGRTAIQVAKVIPDHRASKATLVAPELMASTEVKENLVIQAVKVT